MLLGTVTTTASRAERAVLVWVATERSSAEKQGEYCRSFSQLCGSKVYGCVCVCVCHKKLYWNKVMVEIRILTDKLLLSNKQISELFSGPL